MTLPRRLLLLALPVTLLVLWQAWGLTLPPKSAAPVPSQVVAAAYELIASGQLISGLRQSLARVLTGFSVAGSLALILGLLMGYLRTVERNLDPIVETFRPVAPIALLPLAILWLGTGTPAAVFVVAWAAFFPMIVNTTAGVKRVDRRLVDAARTMGLSQLQILRTVILPATLPAIMVGARLAMGAAWGSIIAAELAVGAKAGDAGTTGGIGEMMFIFYAYSVTLDGIVVCMLTVGLVALLIDQGLRLVQRRLMPWAVV